MADGIYENYPLWMVVSTLLVQLAIYGLGAYIILQFGAIFLAVFVACVLVLEYRILRHSCAGCYYYDRLCCFGRGRLCALFFEKGDPKAFSGREIRWTAILPDFLVSLGPLALGILLLIMRFDVLLLGVMVALGILAFPVQGFIRGTWSCRFCRQKEIGCPAERLFGGKGKERKP